MRAVVQRVASARVLVAGEEVSEIGIGLLVLVGVERGDTARDADALADKVAGLRIFPDDAERMNRAAGETGGEVMVVSQFTLLGDVRKGRRPSFAAAAAPEEAARLIDRVIERIAAAGLRCAGGRFGAKMAVELVNDGPVTLIVETSDGRVV